MIELPPDLGPPGWGFSGGIRSGVAVWSRSVHERYRGFVPDGAVWADLVVVPAPFLHVRPGIVKAEEPVGVQALGPELAVEGLDEGVVRRLSPPAEVEHDSLLVGP